MVIFSKGGTATGNLDYNNLIKVVPLALTCSRARIIRTQCVRCTDYQIISASAVGVELVQLVLWKLQLKSGQVTRIYD